MTEIQSFKVIIVGGSYAGLSAAMALGRSLRSVLIIDSGMPCNRQTPKSHNFITQDGVAPGMIASIAKEQVLQYPTVKMVNEVATAGTKTANGFVILTQSGKQYRSGKLIFATGIKDTLPAIPGFAACWGISVVHCPYCHGYEMRGRKTAIFGNGGRAFHLASLVRNLTDEITILTSGIGAFDAQQTEKLNLHGIVINNVPVANIEHENGYVKRVVFEDGRQTDFGAMYGVVPFEQHCRIPEQLGCVLTENGHLYADAFQQTNVPGVLVCGDNSNMMRSLANAVYTGNVAGVMVNMVLTNEAF